jgi:chromosome segregation ATPase
VSVDTKDMRLRAGGALWHNAKYLDEKELLCSAADEIDDLRTTVSRLVGHGVAERAAHAATKRDKATIDAILEEARGAIAAAYRDASGELTTALDANERLRSDLSATKRELEEARANAAGHVVQLNLLRARLEAAMSALTNLERLATSWTGSPELNRHILAAREIIASYPQKGGAR